MMTFKKIIGGIHLWLGLVSGIFVFIISITGCLYVFRNEIETLTRPFQYVNAENREPLNPLQLKATARDILDGKQGGKVTYRKGYATVVEFYNENPYYFYSVYLHPYTGEVIKVYDESGDFFEFVFAGHYHMWLPHEIGKPLVASATLIFVISLISGFILWYPKNKAARKQRLRFKWKATTKWRRKNYDLHNILGFYASFIALILALTGLTWGFEWFAKGLHGLYELGNGKEKTEQTTPFLATSDYSKDTHPVVFLWQAFRQQNPGFDGIYAFTFDEDSDSSEISLFINYKPGTAWKANYIDYDPHTLAEKEGWFYDRLNFADRAYDLNYDIHVGAIGGLPTKILAFCASLVAASLPITGFIIWWGRRKKN